MNNLNSVLIEGNLVRDPELRQTPKGTSVGSFTIGSNRFYRQNDESIKESSFFAIETWGRLAENCAEYLTKGRGVRVVGRLKQDRWTDADGNPHNRVKIVAEHVEFLRKPQTQQTGEAEDISQFEETDAEFEEAEV